MPAANFTKGAVVVIFSRAPQRPQQRQSLLQSDAQSAGGEVVGGGVYATDGGISLSWQGMTTDDLAALEDFFLNQVNGMADDFTYTDTNGVAQTVKFVVPKIDATEKAYGRHDVNLSLVVI